MPLQGLTEKIFTYPFFTVNDSGEEIHFDVENFSAKIESFNNYILKEYEDTEITHDSTGIYSFTVDFPLEEYIYIVLSWKYEGLEDGRRILIHVPFAEEEIDLEAPTSTDFFFNP